MSAFSVGQRVEIDTRPEVCSGIYRGRMLRGTITDATSWSHVEGARLQLCELDASEHRAADGRVWVGAGHFQATPLRTFAVNCRKRGSLGIFWKWIDIEAIDHDAALETWRTDYADEWEMFCIREGNGPPRPAAEVTDEAPAVSWAAVRAEAIKGGA